MPDQKAFVFDTNFIFDNKNLTKVVAELKEKGFTAYITQVAISERIAQNCRNKKHKYEDLEKIIKETKDFASITINKSYKTMEAEYHKGIQKKYEDLFGEHIISFSIDKEMFQRVLDRSYMKVPPFIVQGESDKGFKDSLMWLSILDFFKDKGEDAVVFVSNDKVFKENKDFLCKEFSDVTGKSIDIQDNAYYRKLIEVVPQEEPKADSKKLSDDVKDSLRHKIKDAFDALCIVSYIDEYRDEHWRKTFTTNTRFDPEYMASVFQQIEDVVSQHLFESELPASVILNIDGRITDNGNHIPMDRIEHVITLYRQIKTTYPDYLTQFYTAVASILNQNYEEFILVDDDENLPF